jgi:hypothetical protein
MARKQSGHPTVQKQRDKWVVRLDGDDTETGLATPPTSSGTAPTC